MKQYNLNSKFYSGPAFFFLFFGIARIFENIRKYFLASSSHDIFDAWAQGTQITGIELAVRLSYYIISFIGISIYFFITEKYLFKGKSFYVLTIGAVVEAVLSIFGYIPELRSLVGVMIATVCFIFIFLFPIPYYINLALKRKGFARRGLIMIVTGNLSLLAGVTLDLPETMYINYFYQITYPSYIWTSVVAPIAAVIGSLLLGWGFLSMFQSKIDPSRWLSNVWIIEKRSGYCVFESNFRKLNMDANRASAYLKGIVNFGNELVDKELQQIGFQDLILYFSSAENCIIAAAVIGKVKKKDIQYLLDILGTEFNGRYRKILTEWDGNVNPFSEFTEYLEILMQRRATGIFLLRSKLIEEIESNPLNVELHFKAGDPALEEFRNAKDMLNLDDPIDAFKHMIDLAVEVLETPTLHESMTPLPKEEFANSNEASISLKKVPKKDKDSMN